MRVLPDDLSVQGYWEHLVYLEAALLARDETAALAAPVTEQLARAKGVLDADLETRRVTLQQAARAAVMDDELDMGIRVTHSDALSETVQNRRAPLFRHLFPAPLSEVIRFALARQVEVAVELVERLEAPLVPEALRTRHVPLLTGLLGRARGVLEERRKAAVARTHFRLERNAFRQEANAVRTAVYADLLKLSTTNKRDRAWAESFFPSSSRRSLVEDEGPLAGEVSEGPPLVPGGGEG